LLLCPIAACLFVLPALAQAPAAPAAPVAPMAAPSASAPASGKAATTTSTQSKSDTSGDRTSEHATEERDRRDATPGIIQEIPTEFQRLVAESIGTPLPIFGASLFTNAPSTFAPVDNIPVTPDYIIGPGDELRVQVYGQVNQQGSYTVDRTGDIAFPNVGTLHVAGIRYAQLADFLKSQLGRVYRNFDVNVNMGQLRSIQIFVVGEARRPGAYTVSSLSTLINALFASGGPLPLGSLRDIQLKRGGDNTVVHFDLYDLLLRGDKSKDVPLSSGDVIFIPRVGPQVAIAGSVNKPAIYEVAPGATVSQVIQLAAGQTSVALGGQIRLERIFEHTMRSIVDVNMAQNQDPVVADGDILSVGAILNRYTDAVTLRGNVTTPGRYVWHSGMHISDLVPSRDQLITREYYRRRNALGNATADYGGRTSNGQLADSSNVGALEARGGSTPATEEAIRSGNTSPSSKGGNSVGEALTNSNSVFPASTDVILSAPDFDWNYAVIERLDPRNLTTSLIAFNPGSLYLRNDQTQNLELFSGDVVTFFSTSDLKVPSSQQTRFIRLEGEFIAAGVYSVEPGETLRHLLARSGGFTSDAYLYGSEFTRESTRRMQQQRLNEYADSLDAQVSVLSANNNARAINDRDAAAATANAAESRNAIARLRRVVPTGRIVLELKPDSRAIAEIPDLPLEDGDRFVVPRVPSTVTVEGQVYSSNSFVFDRGRREHDYLRQAGGPDRDADRKRTFILRADGSVFSRQYGNVDGATIFPGDTIVVPPQLERHALLRNLIDISSIISGFGLGAAAIYVLGK
jgi:polysaccharide export outer membrane protein